jgi:putative cell wall-binding protein
MKFALSLLVAGAFILSAASTSFAATVVNEDEQVHTVIVNGEQEIDIQPGTDAMLDCTVCKVQLSGSDEEAVEANETSEIFIVKGKLVLEK